MREHKVSVTAPGSKAYASATITWNEGPEVTVEVSSQNSWRIKKSGSMGNTNVYLSGLSSDTYGTFEVDDGTECVFQIFDTVEEQYSNHDASCTFVVNFVNDSGDSGSDETSYTLSLSQGAHTLLTVYRCYPPEREGFVNNRSAIYEDDEFEITADVDNGYKLKEYNNLWNNSNKPAGETYSANFEVVNLRKNMPTETGTETYSVPKPSIGNVYIGTEASPIEYKLSINAGTGSSITIYRKESSEGSTGYINANDTIYYDDKLVITFEADVGYELSTYTVNGVEFTSGDEYVVSGDLSISATAKAKIYKLILNPDTGSTITVKRTSSPIGGLANKTFTSSEYVEYADSIYYSDVLEISFSTNAGYEIQTQLVNQEDFISGDSYNVASDVEVTTITNMAGTVRIYNGSAFERYFIHIYDGTSWSQYMPYIFDGTSWNPYS